MRVAVFKRREHDADAVGPGLLFLVLEHQAHEVGIANRYVAFTSMDGLDLSTVVALRFAGKVCLQALKPHPLLVFPVMGNNGGRQSQVVGIGAGTNADASFPFFVCRILVGGNLAVGHAVF